MIQEIQENTDFEIFFLIFHEIYVVSTCSNRLTEAILTNTNKICFNIYSSVHNNTLEDVVLTDDRSEVN